VRFFIELVQNICENNFFFVSLQAGMCILLSIVLVALAMMGLCIRVLVKKNGRFSSQHIGGNKAMRERGIHCVNTQDYEQRHKKKINVKNI